MFFKSGSRTRRRVTFFCAASATAPALLYLLHPCSRKASNQRKGGPIAAHVLRSSHLSGDGRMGFLPICRRAASLPHPFGLFPTNTPVLDAANGRKARYCVT